MCFLGLLAGCSKAGAPGGSDPAVIHFAIAADPASLNPLAIAPDAASVELQLARLSFEPFVDLDARGRPVPALLDRIPTRENGGISADGRTLTFHLRPQARWSDGTPVTSGDVLFTLRAIMDRGSAVRSTEGYDLVDRAVALDARTVRLHLKHAWAPAATTLFSYGAQAQFVLPSRSGPFSTAAMVVDGPYQLVQWARGDRLTYRPNPHYWRASAQRSLDVRIVTDPSTNLTMLQSGELDWNLIAPSQYAVAAQQPRMRFALTPTAVVAALVFNTAHAPLNDVRVRRALAMAVDRGGISSKLTLGKYPVTNMLQPQFSWAYDPSIRQPGFDPHAADAALDAAGWRRGANGMRLKNGAALRLTYVQFPESSTGVRVAATVQAELRERGIEVTVKSISNAQLFLPHDGILATGNFDLAYVPFTMGADPDDSFVLACNAPSNYMRWCDQRVDALEREALGAASVDTRKRDYAAIGGIVARDVPLLFLFNARYVYAYRDRLSGFAPNAFLPTWNAWQWRL
jgi:peptide/nickel transport system substrate-binding protein